MKQLMLAALIFSLVTVAKAEDEKGGDFGKGSATVAAKTGEPRASLGLSSATHVVLARNVVVAAKDSALFEFPYDLSGIERISVSITTIGDPKSSLKNARIGVAWTDPGDWYVLTDMILGSSFYYYDHGGANVPSYGPLLKLGVFNDGTTPLTITQLAVYAVAH